MLTAFEEYKLYKDLPTTSLMRKAKLWIRYKLTTFRLNYIDAFCIEYERKPLIGYNGWYERVWSGWWRGYYFRIVIQRVK